MTSEIPAREFVVISDLHIGSGDALPTWASLELFTADRVFTAFVSALIERTTTERVRLSLIVLGDLFDFPRVFPEKTATPDSDADLIARLDCIQRGHPALFDDLARLVAAGIELVIVPGNHDRGLARPAVFDHLRAMIATDRPETVRCEPWHVVVPGVLYAEHGQQYHDINAFEQLLDARRSELSRFAPTIGGAIDNLMRAAAKDAATWGGVPPESITQVVRSMATSPRKAIRLVRPLTGLATAVVRSGTNVMLANSARTRYREQLAALPESERRLAPRSLVDIELISERRRRATWRRLATTIVRGVLGRMRSGASHPSPRTLQSGKQLEAARAVDAVLRKKGEAVPIYVMGHTHNEREEASRAGASSSRLINTGTWIDGHGAPPRTDGYPYAIVRHDGETGSVAGSLRRWDPVRGQIDGP